MPGINKLAATKVARLTKPGRYGDGAGLWLQVAKAGSKSWIFQFTSGGRERQLGLGSLNTISLGEARKLAKAAREQVAKGIDPIEAKKALREQATLEEAKGLTFKEAATDYIAAKSPEWRNPKHRQQWSSTLETYAYPVIGRLAVADIETSHILKILKPLWQEKSETATRLRGRIERILSASKAAGYRSGDNPARWKDHLEHSLANPSKFKRVRHHMALPYEEMPAFMKELRSRNGISARALEVLILTATRTGSLIGMRDDELDFEAHTWTIPEHRMKTGIEHVVPLGSRAIAILQSVEREKGNPHVFAGLQPGAHLSNMAMLELIRGMKPGYVPHGFRSTFTDWANETTPTPHHVIEMALAHAIENKTEAAYRRGDLLNKRRKLMGLWEQFLYGRELSK